MLFFPILILGPHSYAIPISFQSLKNSVRDGLANATLPPGDMPNETCSYRTPLTTQNVMLYRGFAKSNDMIGKGARLVDFQGLPRPVAMVIQNRIT